MRTKMIAIAISISLFQAAALHAQFTHSIDILDAGDEGGPAPHGLLVVDIAVDVPENDYFVATGIVGHAFNGAALHFDGTPSGSWLLPPGAANPFVTFFSAAYERNATARFAPAATPEEQTVAPGPGWESGPFSRIFEDEIDASFFVTPPNVPPAGDPWGRDGYVLRIVLDIGGVVLAGGSDAVNYRIFQPGLEPTGYSPVFLSDAARFGQSGTHFETHGLQYADFDWGVYVPEAGTLWLGVFAAGHFFRRPFAIWRRGTCKRGNLCE